MYGLTFSIWLILKWQFTLAASWVEYLQGWRRRPVMRWPGFNGVWHVRSTRLWNTCVPRPSPPAVINLISDFGLLTLDSTASSASAAATISQRQPQNNSKHTNGERHLSQYLNLLLWIFILWKTGLQQSEVRQCVVGEGREEFVEGKLVQRSLLGHYGCRSWGWHPAVHWVHILFKIISNTLICAWLSLPGLMDQ